MPRARSNAQRIAEAEAHGYRNGFEAGSARPRPRPSAASPLRASDIAKRCAALSADFADIEARLETEAVEVAVAVARKLARRTGRSRAARPRSRRWSHDCFRHLASTPHVVVRVNDALYDDRARAARGDRASTAASRAASSFSPSPTSPAATAASNGPTAASCANAAKSKPAIDEPVGRYMASRTEHDKDHGDDR